MFDAEVHKIVIIQTERNKGSFVDIHVPGIYSQS